MPPYVRPLQVPCSGLLSTARRPLVSSDIIRNPHSSIFDALSTSATGDGYIRVVSWYDNEWGYSNRVVDLLERMLALMRHIVGQLRDVSNCPNFDDYEMGQMSC
jgi:glyceraldehyde-3-phosphate dehydrogenase/erythrose-4-phosphate dehydrogenase